MSAGTVAFVLQSTNPVGGLFVSIPFAVLKLREPAWFVVAIAVPAAYLQVLAVDGAWNALERAGWPCRSF